MGMSVQDFVKIQNFLILIGLKTMGVVETNKKRMKKYLIPLIISVIVLVSYFSIFSTTIQENSLSKQCDIPDDVNFVDRRSIISTPNDGKPHYSIQEEFSIHYTVPIGYFEVDENSHSLILKPVPTSHGYVIMCDPLPVLENEEIGYHVIDDTLKINVNNNTRIEIVGVLHPWY